MKIEKIIAVFIILGIYLISMISLASALTITSVDTDPKVIAPGEASIIRIGVENEGNKDVEDVSISLDLANSALPFAPYGSSSEVSFDEIQDGRIKYAEFEIIALNNAESGIYKIPLEINYKIKGETQISAKKSLIGISVNSKPIIDVGIEDGLLLKAQENKVSIKVTNKGLSNVKFLEIELQGGIYYTILSQKNVYIGDINSDDFDTAEFNVFFKENTPSNINLPVIVKYKDGLNNKYEENFNLQTTTYTKKRATDLGLIAKSNTITYIIAGIIVIVVYIIYRSIKKRRKRRIAEKIF